MLRRSPRALALFAAALVVALVTAIVVASDLAALHRRAHDLGPQRTVLIARRDLPMGTVVTGADVRTRDVHGSQLPRGVTVGRDEAVGRVVSVPVLRGGYVAERNLAPRRRHGLDGAVPRGMRAIRVVVTDALRPRVGAPVDVLATFDVAGDDAGAIGPEADLVARGALVLGVDTARASDGGSAVGVTILVTEPESRALAFAAAHGVLTVTLVPPEDARG